MGQLSKSFADRKLFLLGWLLLLIAAIFMIVIGGKVYRKSKAAAVFLFISGGILAIFTLVAAFYTLFLGVNY